MANVNKWLVIGRICTDIQVRNFQTGSKLASFRVAVDNRKKNQATGQWEADPCFVDVKFWGSNGGLARLDAFLKGTRKGSQVYLETHLETESWEDKNGGGKRSRLVAVVEDFQFLDAKAPGSNSDSGSVTRHGNQPATAPAGNNGMPADSEYDDSEAGEIPF